MLVIEVATTPSENQIRKQATFEVKAVATNNATETDLARWAVMIETAFNRDGNPRMHLNLK